MPALAWEKNGIPYLEGSETAVCPSACISHSSEAPVLLWPISAFSFVLCCTAQALPQLCAPALPGGLFLNACFLKSQTVPRLPR